MDAGQQVVDQRDLIAALTLAQRRGGRISPPALKKLLDEEGTGVVLMHFPHADGAELRIVALLKIVGSSEPVNGRVTLPLQEGMALLKTVERKSA